MEFRFNPDSGVVTIVQNVEVYNAKKREVARELLKHMDGDDPLAGRCECCNAYVDLTDIGTFEILDGLMVVCYFCTCDPNAPAQIESVFLNPDVYLCNGCKVMVWEQEAIYAGPVALCPHCEEVLDPVVSLSSSTNLNSA